MTPKQLFRTLQLFALYIFLAGCGRYAISVNEKTVYEPAPLFSDYSIADVDLKSCVKDTIAEKQLTKAEQLKQLICPPGEISSLKGIQIFANIEQLGLASNRITEITRLSQMQKLKRLNLRGNQVKDFTPLSTLNNLSFVDIRENDDADCGTLQPLDQANIELAAPEACR